MGVIFDEEELKAKAFDFIYEMDSNDIDRINIILDFVKHIIDEKTEQTEAWTK